MNWDEPARTQDEPELSPEEGGAPRPAPRRFDEHDLLGAGASGRIVRAVDTRLARDVALKIVGPDQPRALARLRREAAVLAALEHPGIVPIYDVLERPDGGLQLALRIIRGRTLETTLVDGKTDRQALLAHLLRASEAVAHAHGKGFVHRDLKPANIMIGEFGETQVIDWGLACPVTGARAAIDDADGPQPDDPRLTRAGSIVGTPAYMPPEQARGGAVDRRADVWALGAVLFEIVTGQRLVVTGGSTESAEVVLDGLRAGYVPDRARLGALPRELAGIARQALMADPERRHADAAAFADALRAALPRPGKRRRVAVGALLAVGVATAFIVTRGGGVPLTIPTTTVVDTADDLVLAEAIAVEAARLASDGHRPDAAAAAARSIALAPSPAAYGVLAGLDLARVPKLLHAAPAPRCSEVVIARDGERWLCRNDGELRLFVGDTPRWTLRRSFRSVVFLGDEVLTLTADGALATYASATGTLTRSGRRDQKEAYVLESDTEQRHAFMRVQAVTEVVVPEGDKLTTRVFKQFTQTGGIHDDGRPAMLGQDGAVSVAGPDGQRTTLLPGLYVKNVNSMVALRDGWAIGTMRGELFIYDDDATLRGSFAPDPPSVIRSITVSPSGRRIAVGSERLGVTILDQRGRVLDRLPRSDNGAVQLVDDRRVVTIGSRRAVWELPAEAPVILPSTPDLTALATDGDALAIGHGRRLTRVDLHSGAVVARDVCPGIIMGVAFRPDGADELAFVSNQHWDVARLDSRSLEPLDVVVGARFGGRRVAYARPDRVLVAHYGPTLFEIVDAVDGDIYRHLFLDAAHDLAVRDDIAAVFARISRELVLIDTRDGVELGRCPGGEVRHIALGADHATIFSGERDAIVAIDPVSCDIVQNYVRPDRGDDLNDIDVSADGAWVAAGSRDGKLFVWRHDGALAASVELHDERVAAIAFDPRSRFLAAGTVRGRLHVVDLQVLDADPAALVARVQAAWGL